MRRFVFCGCRYGGVALGRTIPTNDSQPLKEWSYENDWETYSLV